MTNLANLLVEQVKSNGWLSLSSITFDNNSVYNVFACSGNIGICEDKGILVFMSLEDVTNTTMIMNKLATTKDEYVGQVRTNTFQDMDCLQWFQAATYNYYRNFIGYKFKQENDIDHIADETYPVATWPSDQDILGCTYNPDTKLWEGMDNLATAEDTGKFKQRSVIPLYETNDDSMSSAIVSEWKKWYSYHNLYIQYIQEQYGLTII